MFTTKGAWDMCHGNRTIVTAYRDRYVVMIKRCATSTMATVHWHGILGAQYQTTPGNIFTWTQMLVLVRLINEGMGL